MTTLKVGDIFEYHNFDDFYLAFIAKDESIVLFRPATRYSSYYSKPTRSNLLKLEQHPKFKKLNFDDMSDDFKACYSQDFCTLKKGSKVDFNFKGTIISGVVVSRGNGVVIAEDKLVEAKFLVNSSVVHIKAEPYLFTQKN